VVGVTVADAPGYLYSVPRDGRMASAAILRRSTLTRAPYSPVTMPCEQSSACHPPRKSAPPITVAKYACWIVNGDSSPKSGPAKAAQPGKASRTTSTAPESEKRLSADYDEAEQLTYFGVTPSSYTRPDRRSGPNSHHRYPGIPPAPPARHGAPLGSRPHRECASDGGGLLPRRPDNQTIGHVMPGHRRDETREQVLPGFVCVREGTIPVYGTAHPGNRPT
jgi:hypothetical protein